MLGLILVVAALLVYFPAWHAGFIWDDDFHLTKNPAIVGNLGFKSIWLTSAAIYYPLTLTTFWIEHALWGLSPAPYHIGNILIHAGCGLLLWRVLSKLDVPGAWLGAAIWTLHPVQVESVAWITELKNTQSGLFYLLSVLLFLQWSDIRARANAGAHWGIYFLALASAAFAILSKSSTVMLPIVIALCWWWRDRRWQWRNLLYLGPFFILSALASAWTIWEQHHDARASGTEWAQSWSERALIAGRDVWFYLAKLIWPGDLMFIYPRWNLAAGDFAAWLSLLGLIVLAAVLWIYRNSWARAPFFAGAYFVVSIFPVLGFFNVYFFRYSFVADHFQYLASMGPLALAGVGIWQALSFVRRGRPIVRLITCAVFLAVCGLLGWQRALAFQNPDSLWKDTLARNPSAWMAHNNYGMQAMQEGRVDDALAHYRQAFALDPQKYEIQNNLGFALLQKGRVEEAFPYLRKAAELQPGDAIVHYNLAQAYVRTSGVSDATGELEKTIQSDPNYVPAYSDLGAIYLGQGRTEESLALLRKAVALDPAFGPARFNLANTLLQLRQPDEARAQLEEALARNPSDPQAQKNLAWLLATSPEERIRNGTRAVALAESANRATSGADPIMVVTLAAAYAEADRFSDAVRSAEQALQRAEAMGNDSLANGIRQYLDLYRSGRPFRDVR